MGADLADVVGVVVDLPFPTPAGDGGGLAAVRGEGSVVVGAVVDGDAGGGDGLPAHGQQLEVVAAGERDGVRTRRRRRVRPTSGSA